MSVAITFILNFIKNKVLEIIKSKYFLVFVLFSLIAFMVFFIIFQLKSKDIKIKELEETLYTTQLKLSNIVIQKNIAFVSNKNYIENIYTNSSKSIEKLNDNKEYNSNEIMTLDKIIKDYNNARSPPR
ncbi:hypothetical protein Q5M87_11435 [Brachyspira innocens]|uniref:hypothetical protein n=1 Tax=Brachyspira innocens TaxID=13264 RepID=UPI0026F2C9BF|nr:hypothetical protein [Brachyspira innocens]MDO6994618.1 hypothetical protein [Brachyspira innocens]